MLFRRFGRALVGAVVFGALPVWNPCAGVFSFVGCALVGAVWGFCLP